MTYYDGQPLNWFCGLFDHYGVPQKTFFAFKAFSEIAACATRVAASCDVAGVDVLAGRNDDGSSALLIANFGVHEGALSVQVNLSAGLTLSPEVFVVDQDHALAPVATDRSKGAASPMELNLVLRKHAVVLVRFRP
jgi:hypothetical protein